MIENVTHTLTGIDMNSNAQSPVDVPVAAPVETKLKYEFTERGLIEHIIKRSLYAIFQRMATMAMRNPAGLIEDLQALRKDASNKALLDYSNMWANHLVIEMDTEGLFEQDAKVMQALCREK